MAHPFSKIFYIALKKSTPMDNKVLKEAKKIMEKGYSVNEINEVLVKMHQGLIDSTDSQIVQDAAEQVERYMD